MELDLIFASNLSRIMEEKRFRAVDVANYLGVSKTIVSEWMHGKKMPRMNKIDQLCAMLGCSRSDLLEEHNEAEQIQDELFTERQILFDKSKKCTAEQLKQLQALVGAMIGE